MASYDPSVKPDASGFLVYDHGALQKGNDLRVANLTSLSAAESWCKDNSSCIGFTTRTAPDATTHEYKIYFKQDAANKNTDANWISYLKAASAPAGPGAQQIWAKPQPNGTVAVILINGGSTPMKQTVTFDSIGLRGVGTRAVRDIWARKNLHLAGEKAFAAPVVAPRSSGFYLLSP